MGTLTAYMWSSEQIVIDIEDVEHEDGGGKVATMLIRVSTPAGTISILGTVSIVARVLRCDQAHVGGLTPGALGRVGLNAIGRKLLEVADVDQIIIQGSTRTTGCRSGKTPREIRFPNH
jgi:hypothetical protein